MRALFVPALTLACSVWASQALAQTRVVYLWYADGGPVPVNIGCAANPPAYTCDFAPTPQACKRAVQRYLDAWYADMDVVFTTSKPPGEYDTVVITRDGGWCGVTPQNLGRGMLGPMCQDLRTGYALVYQCATDPKRCATIIANEQAHLVGLEHTISERDVMNENFLTTHEGFEDALNAVVHPPVCQREQNSYQKMKERVGAWMGGAKPVPFDPEVDGGADAAPVEQDAAATDPVADGPAPDEGAGGSGGGAPDAGRDAADAGTTVGDDSGGCGCDVGGRPGAAAWWLIGVRGLAAPAAG